MTKKERAARNAALQKNVEILDYENRDWLVMCLLGIKDDLRALDITAAQLHLEELLDTVAEK